MHKYIKYKVIDNDKFTSLEAIHVPDTSTWQIFLNGKIRYHGIGFTQEDLKNRIDYIRHWLVLEEQPQINDEGEIKRVRRSKEEMNIFKRGLAVIKRGRGRPPGSKNKVK